MTEAAAEATEVAYVAAASATAAAALATVAATKAAAAAAVAAAVAAAKGRLHRPERQSRPMFTRGRQTTFARFFRDQCRVDLFRDVTK